MVRKQAFSIAGVAAVLVLGGGPAAYAGGGPGGHGGDRGDRGCQGGQRHGGQEQGGTPKIACQLPPRDQTALRTCRVGHHDVGYARWARGRGHAAGRVATIRCYSALDRHFLRASIESDLAEIMAGQLAQQKGTRPEVKALGARLIQDHTLALQQATAVAQRLGIDIPQEPNPVQQWALKVVATFSGAAFDREFSALQVAGHTMDIEEGQEEVAFGRNTLVRCLAQSQLPVLQEHLAMAQAALQAAGGA